MSTVGAGVPAKAACQAQMDLGVPASSQASQLPQWNCVRHQILYGITCLVGAGLPAKAEYLNDRGGSDLHRLIR
jgi:hypothetical protein